MADENQVIEEEVLSEDQEIEAAMALMEDTSDDTDDSDGDAGDSGGTAGESTGVDDGAGGDSGAGDEDDPGEKDQPEGESAEKPDKEKRLATQWSKLLKKENEFRKEKAKNKERDTKVDKVAAILENIQEDPYSAAEKLFGPQFFQNWTMKKLGKEAKEEPETPKERVLRERIEQLEGAKKEEAEQAEAGAEDASIKAYEADVKTTIEAAGDEFELMRTYPGGVTEARAWAELYAEEFAQVPHPKDAIGAMEKYFREQLKTGLNTKYGKSLIAELSAAASNDEDSDDIEGDPKPKGKKAKTVKNDLAATSGGVVENKIDSIEEEDMIADAEREFERQLALADNQ